MVKPQRQIWVRGRYIRLPIFKTIITHTMFDIMRLEMMIRRHLSRFLVRARLVIHLRYTLIPHFPLE